MTRRRYAVYWSKYNQGARLHENTLAVQGPQLPVQEQASTQSLSLLGFPCSREDARGV